jgi:hypothetical protein
MSQNQTTCPNCGTVITCGCQQRTASNGVQACTNCIGTYEQQLHLIRNTQANKN